MQSKDPLELEKRNGANLNIKKENLCMELAQQKNERIFIHYSMDMYGMEIFPAPVRNPLKNPFNLESLSQE